MTCSTTTWSIALYECVCPFLYMWHYNAILRFVRMCWSCIIWHGFPPICLLSFRSQLMEEVTYSPKGFHCCPRNKNIADLQLFSHLSIHAHIFFDSAWIISTSVKMKGRSVGGGMLLRYAMLFSFWLAEAAEFLGPKECVILHMGCPLWASHVSMCTIYQKIVVKRCFSLHLISVPYACKYTFPALGERWGARFRHRHRHGCISIYEHMCVDGGACSGHFRTTFCLVFMRNATPWMCVLCSIVCVKLDGTSIIAFGLLYWNRVKISQNYLALEN